MTSANIERNNPVTFYSYRAQTLESAYNLLLSTLQEYAETNNLPPREVQEIKKLFQNAYVKKKAAYFLDAKLRQLENRLDKAIGIALGQSYQSKHSSLNNGFYSLEQTSKFDDYEQY